MMSGYESVCLLLGGNSDWNAAIPLFFNPFSLRNFRSCRDASPSAFSSGHLWAKMLLDIDFVALSPSQTPQTLDYEFASLVLRSPPD
jgi:hypothetical protein